MAELLAIISCTSKQWRRLNESGFQIKGPQWVYLSENVFKEVSQCFWKLVLRCVVTWFDFAETETERLHSAASSACGHLSNPSYFWLNIHQSTSTTNHCAICRQLEKYCLLESPFTFFRMKGSTLMAKKWSFTIYCCNCFCSGFYVTFVFQASTIIFHLHF